MDTFAALGQPVRRRLLDELRGGERTVGQLVERVRLSQPAVSKHLRVMKEAGLVAVRVEAQRRCYRIEPTALRELDRWLEGYRALWSRRLDALERQLEESS